MTSTDENGQYEEEIKGIFKAVFRVVPPEELVLRQYWSENHIELAGKLYSVIRKLTPGELLTLVTPQAADVPEKPKEEDPATPAVAIPPLTAQAAEPVKKPRAPRNYPPQYDRARVRNEICNLLYTEGEQTVYDLIKKLEMPRSRVDAALKSLRDEEIVGRSRENQRVDYRYDLTVKGKNEWLKTHVSVPHAEPEKAPEAKQEWPKAHIAKKPEPGKSAETIQKEMYKFMAEDSVICRGIYRMMYERFKDFDAEPVGAYDIKDYLLKYHKTVLEGFDFGPNNVNVMRAGTLLLEQMCKRAVGAGKWIGLPLIQKANATTYTVNHSAMKGFAKANRWQ